MMMRQLVHLSHQRPKNLRRVSWASLARLVLVCTYIRPAECAADVIASILFSYSLPLVITFRGFLLMASSFPRLSNEQCLKIRLLDPFLSARFLQKAAMIQLSCYSISCCRSSWGFPRFLTSRYVFHKKR